MSRFSQNETSSEVELAKAFRPSHASLQGLRNTVLIRLLLVSLIPMVAISIYFHFAYMQTLEQRSREALQSTAGTHRDAVDRFIRTISHALSGLGESHLTAMPPDKAELSRLHGVLKHINPSVLDLGIFDAAGTQLRYVGPFEFLEGRNYSEERWFKALAQSDSGIYISDVYMGYRDRPHFAIAVRQTDNEQVWYWRMTIDPTLFSKIVDDVAQIEGAHAFILNAGGVFQCVDPEIAPVLTRAFEEAEWKSSEGTFETGLGTTRYLIATADMHSVDWKLVVRQPLEIAYAPVKQTRWVIMGFLVVGLGLIVITSLFATTSLMRRYMHSEQNRAELIDQLFQAGKMSTMGEMAAGIAHEINNPLAIILSEVGLLKDYLDPTFGENFDREAFSEHLDSIRDETNRCRTIIHKLLGFARRQGTNIAETQINDVIRQSVDLIQKELTLENIEIVIDLDDEMPVVQSDGEQLKQVILNLIKNASDAIGKYGIITVMTSHSRDYLSIIVSDTGCGISEKNLSKLFLPFWTTKEVGKGTGLGLSITHGIVTQLGGKINVASQLGKGTSFEIILPRTRRRKK